MQLIVDDMVGMAESEEGPAPRPAFNLQILSDILSKWELIV